MNTLHNSCICVTWLIHMCDMTHQYVWHDSFICETWLIHNCDMTHSDVWHDSFISVTWRIHVWYHAFTRVPWLIHTCDMTHSHVCHDSFTRVPWLIHTCAMTHSHVCHDSFTRVPWLIHTCDMTQQPFTNGMAVESWCTCEWATWLIHVRHHTTRRQMGDCWVRERFVNMGWLRSVGSINLKVSFAEYCLFYRAFLHRLIILSILLTEATA